MILHLVNVVSKLLSPLFQCTLRPGDQVLLIQQAVNVLGDEALIASLVKKTGNTPWALDSSLQRHGLTASNQSSVRVVSVDELVRQSASAERTLCW